MHDQAPPVRDPAQSADASPAEPRDLLPPQRHLFAIPREVAYFNCAYMSPLLGSVEQAGIAGLCRKRRPWEITPADFSTETERARSLFAQMIGAGADSIAIVPAVSYGMATATANLSARPGQTVVLMAEEFPSAVYACRDFARRTGAEILTVARPEDGDWTQALLEAVDDRTALVCISQTHWVCGGLVDLARLGAHCRDAGAALVIDATQSAGALPIDVGAIDPDFLVTACYKWLMGPYALGFMYVAPRHQGGRPLEQGWAAREGAEHFQRLIDYREAFQHGARRFDVGERSNFALVPAAATALEQLLAWTPGRIAATLAQRTAAIAELASVHGAVALPAPHRSPHYLGLRFADGLPADLPARLAARGVHVSARGDRLRITPHLYNDDEDTTRLARALEEELGPARRSG